MESTFQGLSPMVATSFSAEERRAGRSGRFGDLGGTSATRSGSKIFALQKAILQIFSSEIFSGRDSPPGQFAKRGGRT
jgi:hypothetical protein